MDTKIFFTANGAEAQVRVEGILTAGMVGVPITFEFTGWGNLVPVAIYKGSGITRTVPLINELTSVVPHEVLAKAGGNLLIGVEGRKTDGTLVIPTELLDAGVINTGADNVYGPPVFPSPSEFDTIMDAVNEIKQGETGNAAQIEQNKQDIATNADNIATNATNIATNASDISTIKSTQQTDREQIDRNTISIGINRNNIRKKIDESEKGVVNGVATLNEDGKVPAEQLPPPPVATKEVFTAVITDEVGRLVCDMTASEIINASRSGIVKATYTDDATGETRTYQYAKQTDGSRAVFEKPGYIEDGVTHQSLIYVDYAGNVTVETREPTAVTCYATCNAEAAPSTSTPVTWYVPKTMPRPSGNVGMMIDVFWANGRADGLGYDISLVWGEQGGAENETIVPTASVSDGLTGEYSIPAEGTVRYQLVEQSGRKRWKYVSGDVIGKQFSTATAAATADKAVPGMAISYLAGMEIYVQLDNGNTAETMRLVPDEGATLPVYGNGTGAKTGDIPAGAILHLKNAGDHWQIINGGSGGSSSLQPLTFTGAVSAEYDGTAPVSVEIPAEGKYELIETITTGAEPEFISRTAEPDGTPYNFKAVTVKVLKTADSEKQSVFYVNGYISDTYGDVIRGLVEASRTPAAKFGVVRLFPNYGYWDSMSQNMSLSGPILAEYDTFKPAGYSQINMIKAGTNRGIKKIDTSYTPLLPGTIVEIWGVRA